MNANAVAVAGYDLRVGLGDVPIAAVAAAAVLFVLLVSLLVRRRRSSDRRRSKRAHEDARKRDPPVDIGETYEFGVREFTEHHSGDRVAVGKVEGFVLFVEDVPKRVGEGDVVRAKVLSFNEGRTSASATFVTAK